MRLTELNTDSDRHGFFDLEAEVYRSYLQWRPSGSELLTRLIGGASPFNRHAELLPYLVWEQGRPVARFVFVRDRNLPGYVLVGWFEALPGLAGLAEAIRQEGARLFPGCEKIVFGLNGHLNYGAGFLLNRFDEMPAVDFPYTQPYYPEYFRDLRERRMITFKTRVPNYYAWGRKTATTAYLQGIRVRTLDWNRFEAEIGIYTELNNACFWHHPYWAERTAEEDLELFGAMGGFFRSENLLFAELAGRAVGYLYWLPDLNELVDGPGTLGVEELRKYQQGFRFTNYRFYEIAVLPGYGGPASLALFLALAPYPESLGCQTCEGGFIFEENRACIAMTRRFFQRFGSRDLDPYRYLAVYEGDL